MSNVSGVTTGAEGALVLAVRALAVRGDVTCSLEDDDRGTLSLASLAAAVMPEVVGVVMDVAAAVEVAGAALLERARSGGCGNGLGFRGVCLSEFCATFTWADNPTSCSLWR